MTTRTSTLLSSAAIALLLAALLGCGPAFAMQLLSCQSSSPSRNSSWNVLWCVTSASSAVLFGAVLSLTGALAFLCAWIIGLVKAVYLRHWGWFLVVLLLSPLGVLLYGLASPMTSVHVQPAPLDHHPGFVAPPNAAEH